MILSSVAEETAAVLADDGRPAGVDPRRLVAFFAVDFFVVDFFAVVFFAMVSVGGWRLRSKKTRSAQREERQTRFPFDI